MSAAVQTEAETQGTVRKPSRRERRRARKAAARLPFGTFWIGGLGRAALTVPLSALAVAIAHRVTGGRAWPLLPDRQLLLIAAAFAAPAALGLGGAMARMQAYWTWGRGKGATLLFGAVAGAPLGAFEALLVLIASGVEPATPLVRHTVAAGAVGGVMTGVPCALLVYLRLRRARARAGASKA